MIVKYSITFIIQINFFINYIQYIYMTINLTLFNHCCNDPLFYNTIVNEILTEIDIINNNITNINNIDDRNIIKKNNVIICKFISVLLFILDENEHKANKYLQICSSLLKCNDLKKYNEYIYNIKTFQISNYI